MVFLKADFDWIRSFFSVEETNLAGGEQEELAKLGGLKFNDSHQTNLSFIIIIIVSMASEYPTL